MVSLFQSKNSPYKEQDIVVRPNLDMYLSFMEGYVRRINEATFNVNIGGIRIGNAKYSRLAQINLKSRIITFSRYAIENVPERGRRYLVLHELAHVKEASHNKRFWDLIERFEPDYRQIGKNLELVFKQNVEALESKRRQAQMEIINTETVDTFAQLNVSLGLLGAGNKINLAKTNTSLSEIPLQQEYDLSEDNDLHCLDELLD